MNSIKRKQFYNLLSALAILLFAAGCNTMQVSPSLTTIAASNITLTSATTGGSIKNDAGVSVTSEGVCWSTNPTPTINDNKITGLTVTADFNSNITGLSPSTKYYVRAFISNSDGVIYGNEVTFTTLQGELPALTTTTPTSIGTTTATAGGNITSDAGSPILARGVCWSTTPGPTVINSKTTNGTGTGSFTSNLTGLLAGTTYYVRAYATNANGTSYGNEVSLTTTQTAIPILSTTTPTAITVSTATAGGNITSDGGSPVTARGVCWNTSTSPTINNSKTSDGSGTGSFTSSLTGLQSGTTYYLRAYASNVSGTTYGNEVSFTTTTPAPTNTSGKLAISTLTSSAGGSYSPRNIVAIWIENSSGTFVKSLMVFAAARIQYLTNWVSNSSKNVVNATTGATQSNHGTRTCSWDGTNVAGTVVTDGTYKVCMELTDKNGTGNFSTFTFTKGPTAVSLTPTNVPSFSNISIVWTPK